MELTYTRKGDYLLPDLTLPEEVPLGKYGILRRTHLKNHDRGMYASLMLSGRLTEHLTEIDRMARERVEQIVSKLLEQDPAPNKTTDQMGWVGHMNSLKHQAEELVLTELIYN